MVVSNTSTKLAIRQSQCWYPIPQPNWPSGSHRVGIQYLNQTGDRVAGVLYPMPHLNWWSGKPMSSVQYLNQTSGKATAVLVSNSSNKLTVGQSDSWCPAPPPNWPSECWYPVPQLKWLSLLSGFVEKDIHGLECLGLTQAVYGFEEKDINGLHCCVGLRRNIRWAYSLRSSPVVMLCRTTGTQHLWPREWDCPRATALPL